MKKIFIFIVLLPLFTKAQLSKDILKIERRFFSLDIKMNDKSVIYKPNKLNPLLYSVPNAATYLKKYRTEKQLYYLVNILALAYPILHHPKRYNYSPTDKFTPREKQLFIGLGISMSSIFLFRHSLKHLRNAALAYNDAVMKK
jgi:hypothetical protein